MKEKGSETQLEVNFSFAEGLATSEAKNKLILNIFSTRKKLIPIVSFRLVNV